MKIPRFLRSMLRLAGYSGGRYALHAARFTVGADHRTTVDVTDGRRFARVVMAPNEADAPCEVKVHAYPLERLLGGRGGVTYAGRTYEEDGYEDDDYTERDVDLGPDLTLQVEPDGAVATALYSFENVKQDWPKDDANVWPAEAPLARIVVAADLLRGMLCAAEDASEQGRTTVVLSIYAPRGVIPKATPITTIMVQATHPRPEVESFSAVLAGSTQEAPPPYKPGGTA